MSAIVSRRRRVAVSLGTAVVTIMTTGATAALAAEPSQAQSSKTSAIVTIAADWKAFFSGETPASKKIALLENGPEFASIIKAQVSSGIAKSTTATVSKVTITSKKTATVRYTILLAGTPALSNQTGTAVYQGGTWKVGTGSFCALLALEGTRPTACKTV